MAWQASPGIAGGRQQTWWQQNQAAAGIAVNAQPYQRGRGAARPAAATSANSLRASIARVRIARHLA